MKHWMKRIVQLALWGAIIREVLAELTVIGGRRAAVASKNVALGLAAQGFYCFR